MARIYNIRFESLKGSRVRARSARPVDLAVLDVDHLELQGGDRLIRRPARQLEVDHLPRTLVAQGVDQQQTIGRNVLDSAEITSTVHDLDAVEIGRLAAQRPAFGRSRGQQRRQGGPESFGTHCGSNNYNHLHGASSFGGKVKT
jgi:hypothetical protein